MGKTSIEWTHFSFNMWRGCTKATFVDAQGKTRLHPGCLNCYAEVDMSVKLHGIKWGKGQERRPRAESGWKEPLKWARAAAKAGERHRVFCASLADVLDPEVPDSMRERLWDTIRQTARVRVRVTRHGGETIEGGLDWLLLTKHPEEWQRIPVDVRPLVWLGTSVSDQETADEWVPRLLAAEGFRYRFLSVEPMVGPVDLKPWMRSKPGTACITCDGTGEIEDDAHPAHPKQTGDGAEQTWCIDCDGDGKERGIDWIIVGGESGSMARPCNADWIRSVVRQCREAGVPCHVKQLGAYSVTSHDSDRGNNFWSQEPGDIMRVLHVTRDEDGEQVRDQKGGDWESWPADLRVREFPST